jgi:hypothetical protein
MQAARRAAFFEPSGPAVESLCAAQGQELTAAIGQAVKAAVEAGLRAKAAQSTVDSLEQCKATLAAAGEAYGRVSQSVTSGIVPTVAQVSAVGLNLTGPILQGHSAATPADAVP